MTQTARRRWTDYSACAAVEGFDGEAHDPETILSAWQYLLDTGLCWRLQGWYGRTVMALIEQGVLREPRGASHERVVDKLERKLQSHPSYTPRDRFVYAFSFIESYCLVTNQTTIYPMLRRLWELYGEFQRSEHT